MSEELDKASIRQPKWPTEWKTTREISKKLINYVKFGAVWMHYAKQSNDSELDALNLDPIDSEKLSGFISAITRMQSVADWVSDWPWTH